MKTITLIDPDGNQVIVPRSDIDTDARYKAKVQRWELRYLEIIKDRASINKGEIKEK